MRKPRNNPNADRDDADELLDIAEQFWKNQKQELAIAQRVVKALSAEFPEWKISAPPADSCWPLSDILINGIALQGLPSFNRGVLVSVAVLADGPPERNK